MYPSLCLLSTSLLQCQVGSGLQKEGECSSGTLESCLKPDEGGFLHPFGDKKIRNKATSRTIATTLSLEETLLQSTTQLEELSRIPSSVETSTIQRTLTEVEHAVQYVHEHIQTVKRTEAAKAAGKVKHLLGLLEKSLETWRMQYPDASPLKIDNRLYSSFPPSTVIHSFGRKIRIESYRPPAYTHFDRLLYCPSQSHI